ncbi:MAG: SDR family oxidoreductase [Planctomycetes bacterium]|nr:SDR family oxidoreductase [Planctomycetota bacterium]
MSVDARTTAAAATPAPRARPIAIAGATGYVGGRLVRRLAAAGHQVRCLVRDPRKLAGRGLPPAPAVTAWAWDGSDAEALGAALAGAEVAYYLIHSMAVAGRGFAARDHALAESFGRAAAATGVQRIVYLGGLGELGPDLSPHLRSRREVEHSLAAGGVPVTTFRAAMLIGSGSASFEILRYLVERLPCMVTPRWVETESQPIAIENVLHYLVACLDEPRTCGRTLDIGGPDVVSYRDLLQATARALGLRRRRIVPVPVLTPRLSSFWVHLVTPVGARIARPLAEGLRNRMVCRNDDAQRLLPQRLLPVEEAIARAVAARPETSWHDAGAVPGDPAWAGGKVFEDARSVRVAAPAAAVFAAVSRLGGANGWHAGDWLWRLRGALDKLVGGPGSRRGRRDPEELRFGDALDFWRVLEASPPHRLRLVAEMKLPGQATLEFEVHAQGPDAALLVQTARFRPRGLLGLAYWYAVLPLHAYVFAGMLRGIARAATLSRPPAAPAVGEPRPAASRTG